MNSNEPLGLPKGSIRAILALLFAGGTIGLAAFSVVRQDGDIPASLAAIVGMTGIIVNSYFQNRGADVPAPVAEPAPTEDPLVGVETVA